MRTWLHVWMCLGHNSCCYIYCEWRWFQQTSITATLLFPHTWLYSTMNRLAVFDQMFSGQSWVCVYICWREVLCACSPVYIETHIMSLFPTGCRWSSMWMKTPSRRGWSFSSSKTKGQVSTADREHHAILLSSHNANGNRLAAARYAQS